MVPICFGFVGCGTVSFAAQLYTFVSSRLVRLLLSAQPVWSLVWHELRWVAPYCLLMWKEQKRVCACNPPGAIACPPCAQCATISAQKM